MAQELSRKEIFDFIRADLPEKTRDVFLGQFDSPSSQSFIDRFMSMQNHCIYNNVSIEVLYRFVALVPVLIDLLGLHDRLAEDVITKNKALCQYFGVPESFFDNSDEIKDPEVLKQKLREKFTLIKCAG